MEENKRIYERPSMEVILLQHETALLTGSGEFEFSGEDPEYGGEI